MLEIKLLPGSEVEIIGEILADDFEACRNQALKELSEKVKVDGFRPGKVPEKILIENVGGQEILEKMAIIALQRKYSKIIEEHRIKAIGRPMITITKIAVNNPLGFKIRTFVMPEIELPDYKNIGKGKKRLEILEEIAEKMKVEIPQILIESEKEKIAQEIKANIEETGLKWGDYLNHIKKTEEEIRKDWEPDAMKRVKYGLILNEIAEKEKIEVSEEELNAEVEKIMNQYKDLDPERVKVYIYGIIRNEKVFKLLESC